MQLARARRAAGLTQQSVADRLGVTGQRVATIEASAFATQEAASRYLAAVSGLVAERDGRP
jgi:transcriptional regulator with XRE-family HTH domain